jgi:Skp family chaperone for outer membrane proteins
MTEQRIWRWAALAIAGLAIALGWHATTPPAGANALQTAPTTSIAVIDLASVLDQLEERVVREGELKAEIEAREGRIREIEQQLNAVQQELDVMPGGTDRREAKLEEAVRMRMQVEFESNFANRVVAVQRKEMQLALFNKIKAATDAYAKAEGWDAVLVTDHNSQIPEGLGPQETFGAIVSTRVLSAGDAIDITDEVARRMNNEFKRGG